MNHPTARPQDSCHTKSETESKDLWRFCGGKAFATGKSQAGRLRSIRSLEIRNYYPPGENKYFCGNLQIITRFCETLDRAGSRQSAEPWSDCNLDANATDEIGLFGRLRLPRFGPKKRKFIGVVLDLLLDADTRGMSTCEAVVEENRTPCG